MLNLGVAGLGGLPMARCCCATSSCHTLLRRVKKDVALQLPQKQEHVLLCPLTEFQRRLYCAFLRSDEVQAILDAKRNMLYGIDILRKICNHPDLVTGEQEPKSTYRMGMATSEDLYVAMPMLMAHCRHQALSRGSRLRRFCVLGTRPR